MITFKSITNIQALLYVYENHPTVCSYALNYNHVQLDWLLKNNLVTISDKTNPRRMLPTQRAEAIVTALLNAQIDESLVTLTPPETQPEPTTKPPLGLMPNPIWLRLRRDDLIAAINRYNEANMEIPAMWYNELAKLLTICNTAALSSNEPRH